MGLHFTNDAEYEAWLDGIRRNRKTGHKRIEHDVPDSTLPDIPVKLRYDSVRKEWNVHGEVQECPVELIVLGLVICLLLGWLLYSL